MNSRTFRKVKAAAAAAGLVLIAGACGEVSGVDNGMGNVQVTLQEASSEALFNVVASELVGAPEAVSGRVDRDMVRSLNVTVVGIQILPYCEDAGEQAGDGQCEDLWETLEIGADSFDLDLLALPSEGDTPEQLAEGTVPVGEYHKIRLFVSRAEVSFKGDISVGRSVFYGFENPDGGYVADDTTTWVTYPVEIPSAQNTGIKADIDLEVTEETTGAVSLLFDSEATFRNVIATGNGRVKMPPVLKARPMYQNQIEDQNQNGG